MKRIFYIILLLTGFAFAPFKDGLNNWTVLKTKNDIDDRNECSLVACNDKIYIVGGGEGNGGLPVEMLDPGTNTWVTKATAPSMFHHFQAVAYNGKIYVLEAFVTSNYPDQVPSSNVYIYDCVKDTWSVGATMPEARRRAAAGAALYNDKIYLVDGIQHGHRSGTNSMFDVYDPMTNSWQQLPDAPHIRDHSTAAVIDDKLYAVGGRNTSLHDADNFMSFFDKVVPDVDCFDFNTNTWSTIDAKLPMGTGGGTLVNYHDKLYYMGGERATSTEPNAPGTDVFMYDPDGDGEWIAVASLNVPRNGTGAAVCNDKIYLAGGSQSGPKPMVPPANAKMNDSIKQAPPPGQQPKSKLIVEVYSE